MYCTKCGSPVSEGEKFCPSCGNAVKSGSSFEEGISSVGNYLKQTNTMVVLGFIVSCIAICLPILGAGGLILSAIGYKQIAGTNQKGKNLAIAGMVIGGILTLFILVAVPSIILFDMSMLNRLH